MFPNSNSTASVQRGTKKPFDVKSSLAKLEMDLAVLEGGVENNSRSNSRSGSADNCALPTAVQQPSSARVTSLVVAPPNKPAPPSSAVARSSRFNRGSEQAMLSRQPHPASATSTLGVRRNSIGGGAVVPGSGAATPASGQSTPRRRDSFNEVLPPIAAEANDDAASVISGSSTTSLRSPRSGKVDSGAVRSKPVSRTAAERMAALDKLARHGTKMEEGAGAVSKSATAITSAQQSTTTPANRGNTSSAVESSQKIESSPSWRGDPTASSPAVSVKNAAVSQSSSSSSSSKNAGNKLQQQQKHQQQPPQNSPSPATEETFRWPEPTAEENVIMSAPRGKMLEKPGTGTYLFVFPDRGFFACRRCHCKIAAAKNKVTADGGYAAFSAYCVANLRSDLVVARDMTTIAVACKSCLCNIGCLHPLHGHLVANSSSLVHCPVERGGPEWEKDDTVFADAVAAEAQRAKAAASPKKGQHALSTQQHDCSVDDDDDDEDDDMPLADRDSVLGFFKK